MNRDRAISLLQSGQLGVKQWNEHRESGGKIPALNNLDFSGLDLIEVDFRGADLSDSNFNESLLNNANLSNANLIRASFNDASAAGAHFGGADLAGAEFVRANATESVFSYADLSGADLTESYLPLSTFHKTNLTNTKFSNSNLTGAIFRNANLNAATLIEAKLTRAVMSDVALNKANLRKTHFTSTKLDGVDVTDATCGATIFSDVDLSGVIGLNALRHVAPSTVGVDTLFLSKNQLPEIFLRGCGIPDALIDYLPSLYGSTAAIEFYSSFISYSHNDEDFATQLHSRMQREGLRVWFAQCDMKSGEKIHEQIDQAIRVHDKLLLVLSGHSMGSEWVKTEIRKARKREVRDGVRILFPIRLVGLDAIREWECFDADVGKDLAVEVREYFIPDFSNWKDDDSFESAFSRLLNDMKAN